MDTAPEQYGVVIVTLFKQTSFEHGDLFIGSSLLDALDVLVSEMTNCYASAEHLKELAEEYEQTTGDVLKDLFLPQKPHIKSGDFGEMLTFLLYCDVEASPHLLAPRKWRWKADSNRAAPHSDVVLLFHDIDAGPAEDDKIICAEVKAKATADKRYAPIQKAITGAENDRTTRLAKTLGWMRKRYRRERQTEAAKVIERFINALDVGTYVKDFRAVAVVDSDFTKEESTKDVEISDDLAAVLTIHLISV